MRLLPIPIFIVNAYQTAAEGEYFAEGDEHAMVDLAQRWTQEARNKHCASEDAQCYGGDELNLFHRFSKLKDHFWKHRRYMSNLRASDVKHRR